MYVALLRIQYLPFVRSGHSRLVREILIEMGSTEYRVTRDCLETLHGCVELYMAFSMTPMRAHGRTTMTLEDIQLLRFHWRNYERS